MARPRHRCRPAARAAQIFGAAEALRTVHGLVIWPERRADYDHAVAGARTQLDDDAFDAAWAAGRAMSLEQAIAEMPRADS